MRLFVSGRTTGVLGGTTMNLVRSTLSPRARLYSMAKARRSLALAWDAAPAKEIRRLEQLDAFAAFTFPEVVFFAGSQTLSLLCMNRLRLFGESSNVPFTEISSGPTSELR
jgi:hypothetical protein